MQYFKTRPNYIIKRQITVMVKYNNYCLLIVTVRITCKKLFKAIYRAINLIFNLIFYI